MALLTLGHCQILRSGFPSLSESVVYVWEGGLAHYNWQCRPLPSPKIGGKIYWHTRKWKHTQSNLYTAITAKIFSTTVVRSKWSIHNRSIGRYTKERRFDSTQMRTYGSITELILLCTVPLRHSQRSCLQKLVSLVVTFSGVPNRAQSLWWSPWVAQCPSKILNTKSLQIHCTELFGTCITLIVCKWPLVWA